MNTFQAALDFLLEHKLYAKVAEIVPVMRKSFKKLNQSQRLHQVPAIQVIVALAQNDIVAADRAFTENLREMEGWATARECEMCEELVRAFRDGDAEKLAEVHALPVWGFLPNKVRAMPHAVCAGDVALVGDVLFVLRPPDCPPCLPHARSWLA